MKNVYDYPHTISYCTRKALQIQSFFDFPEEKRPPESIWFDELALKEWFDNISSGEDNSIDLNKFEIE